MPKTAILIQYDGSKFYGFQRQKTHPSVQQALEEALFIAIRERVIVEAAGRTDTGVHARGMIASFSSVHSIDDPYKFIKSLNALTPEGIGVLAVKNMPEEFHAQFSCNEREYEYWILNSPAMQPLFSGKALWIRKKLDIEKIQSQLDLLVGEHDFSSLTKKASLKYKSTPIRDIKEARILESNEFRGLYRVKIRANSFLHNMIRIIVGTVLDIMNDRISDKSILQIIEEVDRTAGGKTIPPDGLYFIRAYYKDYPEVQDMYKILY